MAKSSEGFSDGYLNNDDDEWRFLQLTTGDGRYRIVVGQEWDYRRNGAGYRHLPADSLAGGAAADVPCC